MPIERAEPYPLPRDALKEKGYYFVGESIHELGSCRMGDDPKKSVLNRFNQAQSVPDCIV